MKQTAVDWLFEQLCETPKDKFAWYYLFEKAKAMEKGQIELAHINGQSEWDIKELRDINKKMAEKYYNQTYSEQ